MDNYQKKIKKYNIKLASAPTLAKKKLYEMKLKQYNTLFGGAVNMYGGDDQAEINTRFDSINKILEEAKNAIKATANAYTKDSVDQALEEIKNSMEIKKALIVSHLEALTTEINELKEKNKQIEVLNDTIKAKEIEINELKTTSEGAVKNKEELIEQKEKEISELKEKNKNLETEKENLIKEHDKLIAELNTQIERIKKEGEDNKCKINVEELKSKLEQIEKELQTMKDIKIPELDSGTGLVNEIKNLINTNFGLSESKTE